MIRKEHDMDFCIFERQVCRQGHTETKWFYTFKDLDSGKKRTRLCKDCYSMEDAWRYVHNLRHLSIDQYLIRNIASDMFLPESEHMNRMRSFGKNLDERSISLYRFFIKRIITDFGNKQIQNIKVSDIEKVLLNDRNHSGSWKNQYLETFCAIYDNTQWVCTKPVNRPVFTKFARNSKKADLLSTEELNLIISRRFWEREQDYILFLLIASCGLRIGEARGLRRNQFLFNKKILVVDGFCKRNGERTNYNKKGSDENRKIRIVPIPDMTIKIVQNYIKTWLIGENNFLFMMNGHPVRQEYLRSAFNRVLKRAGIQTKGRKIVPHSLRFTFVTRMRRNLDIETVQKIAGHASAGMTEYYTRFGIDEIFESMKQSIPVANMLFL